MRPPVSRARVGRSPVPARIIAAALCASAITASTIAPQRPVGIASTAMLGASTTERVPERAPAITDRPAPAVVAEADLRPGIHYRDSEAHAADADRFEPGGPVTVPFTPRAGDAWEVDGDGPRALPSAGGTFATADAPAAPAEGGAGGPTAQAPWADNDVQALAPVSARGLAREVFGFLPYWELSDRKTVLDWRVLSTVAYFGVGCTDSGALARRNPDGSLTAGWAGWTSSRMTEVIDAAHASHTRVVLTVSCFAWSAAGATTQANLLSSPSARARLARQVAAAVRDRGADGVNLDFEPIPVAYGAEYVRLIRSVRSELNAIAPGYQLTFDALGSVGSQPIAEGTAKGAADAVVIMGYDYRTDQAAVAGSISPLAGPAYDLTDTVEAYTALVAPSKVILGVPWYGRAWSTPTRDLHAPNISGPRNGESVDPTYADAADLAALHGRRWDAVERAPWTAYRKQVCTAQFGCVTTWRQTYYDDAASLKLRYDLVNRSGIRGVAIWALGYDGTRPELRAALADRFLNDHTAPVAGFAALPERARDEGFRVTWRGSDDESRIAGYDLQVSIDGGAWAPWRWGLDATSAVYLGATGHAYAFRIRATDLHGNTSPWYPAAGGLGAAASRPLAAGSLGVVVTDGLRLRGAPSLGGSILGTLEAGTALPVLAGPVTANGFAWYQVGPRVGWVAAAGNGYTNVVPRPASYGTTVDAAISGLRMSLGGPRLITPNGDGVQDRLRLDWTNRRSFERMTVRILRTDGRLVGELSIPRTAVGPATWFWNGRIGGRVLPRDTYVLQLRGTAGSTTWRGGWVNPGDGAQLQRYGFALR